MWTVGYTSWPSRYGKQYRWASKTNERRHLVKCWFAIPAQWAPLHDWKVFCSAYVGNRSSWMFAQKHSRVRRTRSTVRRTAGFISGCACRRRWCVTVDGTVDRARTSWTVDRAPATPETSPVRTASVFHSDGSVTAITTVEICRTNRPTAVRYYTQISLYLKR